jgi:hypothetical protein
VQPPTVQLINTNASARILIIMGQCHQALLSPTRGSKSEKIHCFLCPGYHRETNTEITGMAKSFTPPHIYKNKTFK